MKAGCVTNSLLNILIKLHLSYPFQINAPQLLSYLDVQDIALAIVSTNKNQKISKFINFLSIEYILKQTHLHQTIPPLFFYYFETSISFLLLSF